PAHRRRAQQRRNRTPPSRRRGDSEDARLPRAGQARPARPRPRRRLRVPQRTGDNRGGTSVKRWISLAVGAVPRLRGPVWVLQGAGVIPGRFMTGQKLWFLIGLIAFLVGVVLVAATARRTSRRK